MSLPADELATPVLPDAHPRWPRWLRRGPLELVASGVIALGSSSPATMRSVVVLPQPEGPSSTTNSPCAAAKSIPFTARVPSG